MRRIGISEVLLHLSFNSRTLGRVRQARVNRVRYDGDVSIHAPWEGCDTFSPGFNSRTSVSIHAPWEGCDGAGIHKRADHSAFQFTHPGKGATIIQRLTSKPFRCFNSRTLGRVRRGMETHEWRFKRFQFTHPGKGATSLRMSFRLCAMFQFTHPGKGATYNFALKLFIPTVSIHAPWEGCDGAVATEGWSVWEFQFTHPGKGATRRYLSQDDRGGVSIHAPWEGCDRRRDSHHTLLRSFNSRTLGRVRRNRERQGHSLRSFNSRTLGRVRRLPRHQLPKQRQFQFTHPGKGATCHRIYGG